MQPVETAAWWVEYAIRNKGAPYYKYHAVNISFWEYYLLDVILFFMTILSIIAISISIVFYKLRKFLIRLFVRNIEVKRTT